MEGWMDMCRDGWMDGWRDGYIDGWMDGWIDTCSLIDRRTYEWMDAKMYGWWMEG